MSVRGTIQNRVFFAASSDIHWNGATGAYMTRFFEQRVQSDFAKNEVFGEAERALQEPHDDDTIVGMWSGEFWGKLEISACRVYEYTRDAALFDFVKESAHRVLSCAREDGYINSYKDSANVFAPNPDEARKLMGWRCDWNWNVWCRKYTLWGLIECAALTGDDAVLAGARKLASQLIDEFAEKNIRLCDTGTANFHGVPSGSILKPMLLLYRMTGDRKFLDFSVSIAEDWDREDGRCPNLIRNALSGRPVHEWYPKSHLWAKAYETMSCLDGLLELYRITGTQKYMQAVEAMYVLLKEHEGNVMGSVGFNDVFAHGAAWPNAISEPCDVIHWMRLCSELFTLTGESKYMDSFEKAFYNAFLVGVSDDGTWGARGVRSSGRHYRAVGQSGCRHNHCCVDNVPRGFLNAVQSTVMTGADGSMYVNLYVPFTGKFNNGSLGLACGEGYAETGRVTLSVSAAAPVTLFLRVPECAGKNAGFAFAGVRCKAEAGRYAKLTLNAGQTEIHADFDFYATLHELPVPPEIYPRSDFRTDRWVWENAPEDHMPTDSMMSRPCAAITYGPLVLARSKKLGISEQAMFGASAVAGRGFSASVRSKPRGNAFVLCRFDVTLDNGTERIETEMCDFGTAADVPENRDAKFFNLYI